MDLEKETFDDHIELHDSLCREDKQLLLNTIEEHNRSVDIVKALEGNHRVLGYARYRYKAGKALTYGTDLKLAYMSAKITDKLQSRKHAVAVLILNCRHRRKIIKAKQLIIELYKKSIDEEHSVSKK